MIIRSKDTSLSFEIDDYQYPEHKSQEKGYDYDANWLEVAIQYSNQNEVKECNRSIISRLPESREM